MSVNFQEVICNYEKCSDAQFKANEIRFPSVGFANNRCIKMVSESGGLNFSPDQSNLSQRCLLWKAYENIIDLEEISFYENLNKNFVRLNFPDVQFISAPNIYHVDDKMVILVTTTTSLYRFIFQYKANTSLFNNCTQNSILPDASYNSYVFPSSASHSFVSATAYQSAYSCIFGVSTNAGVLIVVRLPPLGTRGLPITTYEIRQPGTGVMTRLYRVIVPSLIGNKDYSESSDTITCLTSWFDKEAFYLATVGRDNRLKLFSAESMEWKASINLLDFVHIDEERLKTSLVEIKIKHLITTTGDILLAILFTANNFVQFIIFKVTDYVGKTDIVHQSNIFADENLNIVDFTLTQNYLWLLPEGKEHFRQYPLYGNMERSNWSNVETTEKPVKVLEIPDSLDPSFVYLEFIFSPGRFSNAAILKALSLYKRTSAMAYQPAHLIPRHILKAEVCTAIESEIHLILADIDADCEEFIDLQISQWDKFYKGLSQFYKASCKSTGLFTNEECTNVFVVKESGLGVVCALDVLSDLYLNNSIGFTSAYMKNYQHLQKDMVEKICLLSSGVTNMRDVIGRQAEEYLYGELLKGEDLRDIMRVIYREISVEARANIREVVIATLENIGEGFSDCINQLVQMFAIQPIITPMTHDSNYEEEAMYTDTPNLQWLTAREGTKLLCNAVYTTCLLRFKFSRDLLLFLYVVRSIPKANYMMIEENDFNESYDQIMNNVSIYHSIVHFSLLPIHAADVILYEKTRKICEILKLDVKYPNMQSRLLNENCSILELFLTSFATRHLVAWDKEPLSDTFLNLDSLVEFSMQILWPSNRHNFALNLLLQCQHVHLHSYLKLIGTVPQYGTHSNQFLLAISYLACHETDKAVSHFIEVGEHLVDEEFLTQLVDIASPMDIIISYYMLLIHLFEVLNKHDVIVYLVKLATSRTNDKDIEMNLWTKKLKYELELKQYKNAFESLFETEDFNRLNKYLRQFISTLCEAGKFGLIISLKYYNKRFNLEEEVVEILESKARTADLSKDNFYDLLYSFNIHRFRYTAAASAMYEYAVRIGVELTDEESLEKQLNAYSICLNALQLARPESAWIVKPNPNLYERQNYRQSAPKRTLGANQKQVSSSLAKSVEILNVEMISRDKYLFDCHLKVMQGTTNYKKAPIALATLNARETVNSLSSKSFYMDAIDLSRLFNLPLNPVFESLINKCISMTRQVENYDSNKSNLWFQEIDFDIVFPDHYTPADCAWRVLQVFLDRFEMSGKSILHHVCANKMIFYEFDFPSWFTQSYKKRNVDELMRLYLSAGLVEDAFDLAIEYVEAIDGKGKELFDLEDFVHSGCQPVWVPYVTINRLIIILEAYSKEEEDCVQMSKKLKETMEKHFRLVRNAMSA